MRRLCSFDSLTAAATSLLTCGSVALVLVSCGPEGSAPSLPDSPPPSTSSQSGGGGQDLAYDRLVEFTTGGDSDGLKGAGWSHPEAGFTWSEGNVATIAARVQPSDRPVTLKFKASGMIKPPELPFQPVEVSANGQKLGDFQIGETAEFSAPVPPALTKAGGLLTIKFTMSKAAAPKAVGLNEDKRVLGICVFNFALSTSP